VVPVDIDRDGPVTKLAGPHIIIAQIRTANRWWDRQLTTLVVDIRTLLANPEPGLEVCFSFLASSALRVLRVESLSRTEEMQGPMIVLCII